MPSIKNWTTNSVFTTTKAVDIDGFFYAKKNLRSFSKHTRKPYFCKTDKQVSCLGDFKVMKLFKYIFLFIFIVAAGFAAYVGLSKGDFNIEKTTTFNAPRELVFNELAQVDNWSKWLSDLDSSVTLSATEQKLTLTNSQTSEVFTLNTTSKTHYSSIIQQAITQRQYGTTTYHITWELTQKDSLTRLDLNVKVDMDYWAKAIKLIKRKTPQHDITQLITKNTTLFSTYLARKMAAYSLNLDGTFTAPEQTYYYYSLSSKNTPKSIRHKRQEAYKQFAATQEKALAQNNPLALFYNHIDQRHHNVIVSFAKFSKDSLSSAFKNTKFLKGSTTSGLMLKARLTGNYSNIPKLWAKAKLYMQENDLVEDKTRLPYEIYKRDGQDTQNPAKWITELYIPVSHRPSTPTRVSQH